MKELMERFADRLDATNTQVFTQIIKTFGEVETRTWVMRPTSLPSEDEYDALLERAREAPSPRKLLQSNQTWKDRLQDPVQMYGT